MTIEKSLHHLNFEEFPVDICVVTFSSDEENDHFDPIHRCLQSIVENTAPDMYRLHIGCNNLSQRAMAYVDSLVTGHGTTKYIGMAYPDKNGTMVFPKYPLMRKIYEATRGEWVIWFDDDIYVTEKDWLNELEYTINQHPEADQFGFPSNIALPLSVKEEWIDDAVWSRPEKIQIYTHVTRIATGAPSIGSAFLGNRDVGAKEHLRVGILPGQ